MTVSTTEARDQVVLAMWVEGVQEVDSLESELQALGCKSFRCLGSVIDDGVVDVLVDATSEIEASAIRDRLSRRLAETGSQTIRSWIFLV